MSTINLFVHEVDFDTTPYEAHISILNRIFSDFKLDVEEVNIVFCSDEYILEINRKYLDHDYYTDIITFPLQKDPLLAELYISIDTVASNAQEFHVTFHQEMIRVMIHGCLHLCGLEDHTEAEKNIMRKMEDNYLLLVES